MEKMLFACPWSEDKLNSWSGIHNQLYKRLSESYLLYDYNTGYYNGSAYSYFERLKKKLKMMIRDDMRYSSIKHYCKKNIPDDVDVCFQFEECPNRILANSYIYIDCSVSYVWHMYKEMPDVFLKSNYSRYDGSIIKRRMELQDRYLGNCKGIFTMGNWMAKWLSEECKIPQTKVHPVGGGANIKYSLNENENMESRREGKRILFVGKDFLRKGGLITFKAFEILKNRIKDAELYVVGSDKRPEEVYNLEGLHWLGKMDFSELPKYFRLCDLFCMPSYFEAYGIVFVEALIFGLPCIGRHCFEMPFFIEDDVTGKLLKSDDPYELADLMYDVLRDPSYKQNVAKNRDIYLDNYSWDSVVKRIINVIEDR